MSIPSNGFVIVVTRERVESKNTGAGKRYRAVGKYECFLDGTKLTDPELSGATVEPRGPGDNTQTGVNKARRIEEGIYPLGVHAGSKYATHNYKKNSKPRPGVFVLDTNVRTFILIHRGIGFKASVGCINLTGSITGPTDNIGPNTSFARMDAFIKALEDNVGPLPKGAQKPIKDAFLVVKNEPKEV